MSGNTVSTSSMIASSIGASSIQFDTISSGNTFVVTTLKGSSINADNLNTPSVTISSFLTTNNLYTSTLVVSSISVTSYNMNQSVYGATSKKTSANITTNVTISSGDILARLDNPPSIPQAYTFGPSVQNLWVAVGYYAGTSNDGLDWTPKSFGSYNLSGYCVGWNGTMWIVGGQGIPRQMYYSYDGNTWIPVANDIFPGQCFGIAWNGSIWVAVGGGGGGNRIGYSTDGINWNAAVDQIFFLSGKGVAWNGSMWVAVGEAGNGTATIAHSSNGINWTAVTNSTNIFYTAGRGIAWNGARWVAVGNGDPNVGQGQNIFAYSDNGIDWTAGNTTSDNSIFEVGNCVAWNGLLWVAGGKIIGAPNYIYNSIATSRDGITWSPVIQNTLTNSVFTSEALGIAWNGAMWIAVGASTDNINAAYSYDGYQWKRFLIDLLPYNSNVYGIAFNSRRPYTLTFPTNSSTANMSTLSSMVTFPITIPATSRLDVASDTYYNEGYTNFSITVNTHAT
jgi:hypothetical protein